MRKGAVIKITGSVMADVLNKLLTGEIALDDFLATLTDGNNKVGL